MTTPRKKQNWVRPKRTKLLQRRIDTLEERIAVLEELVLSPLPVARRCHRRTARRRIV